MASELKVDKFTGVTTAGSIDVTGEGNSTTTNLQQGLAKAWVQYDMGDNALDDSFNVSSLSDETTGRANFTVTNAFGSANFAYAGLVGNNCTDLFYNGDNVKTTSTTGTLRHLNTGTSDVDVSPFGHLIIHGDLA